MKTKNNYFYIACMWTTLVWLFPPVIKAQEPAIQVIRNGEIVYKKLLSELDSVIFYKQRGRCGAMISATEWRDFMCHNLGADVSADPFIPGWKLHGSYYKWGTKLAVAPAPTGSAAGYASDGIIIGWNSLLTPRAGSWGKIKTANDPCPQGFRIPTKEEWEAVFVNNTIESVGTWAWMNDNTNYSSGKMIGTGLFLPAAGQRIDINGSLRYRGLLGYYQSSDESDTTNYVLSVTNAGYGVGTQPKKAGFSVRCIQDNSTMPEVLTLPARNVTKNSLSIGGKLISTGQCEIIQKGICYGMNENPTIQNNIVEATGTTEEFNLVINALVPDKTYYLKAFATNVNGTSYGEQIQINTLWDQDCGAYVANGEWKKFMCHNLGAVESVNPYKPDWRLIGDYYQWGSKVASAKGPIGESENQTNAAAIAGWFTGDIASDKWADFFTGKTINDPCPDGFIVPSRTQWEQILANNTVTNQGTWTNTPTNYNSGISVGNNLFLPATGYRDRVDGSLKTRGIFGHYWSVSKATFNGSWSFAFSSSDKIFPETGRDNGLSVRCIAAEPPVVFTNNIDHAKTAQTTAVVSGNITNDGSAEVLERGFVYKKSDWVMDLLIKHPSNGKGVFVDTIKNLTPGSKYLVKAYAINKNGVTYGVEKELFTKTTCGAYVSVFNEWKEFKCQNLGAAVDVNPFAPDWRLHGDYYQWGKKTKAADGPTGTADNQANAGAVSGWNTVAAVNGSWTDAAKTANDPCPDGYKVPSSSLWRNVSGNNAISRAGTWTEQTTNYSSGLKVGDYLYLPATGIRYSDLNGELYNRGKNGYYWSSTEINTNSEVFTFSSGSQAVGVMTQRADAVSVRCVKE